MKKKILLIDDEVIITAYLSNFFRNAGYEIEAAASGSEALQKAKEEKPNLVLLDLVLPDADGVEVLTSLKKDHPDVPVVILTGLVPDPEILEECSEAGVDGFVTKDATSDHLLMHVKRLIG